MPSSTLWSAVGGSSEIQRYLEVADRVHRAQRLGMAGRRMCFGGTPYTSWTLPKLRAELSRTGHGMVVVWQEGHFGAKLRSAVAPSDGNHVDVGDASPTRQSEPSAQPASTELQFLREEVRRLQETIARIKGTSGSSSGPALRTVTALIAHKFSMLFRGQFGWFGPK